MEIKQLVRIEEGSAYQKAMSRTETAELEGENYYDKVNMHDCISSTGNVQKNTLNTDM